VLNYDINKFTLFVGVNISFGLGGNKMVFSNQNICFIVKWFFIRI